MRSFLLSCCLLIGLLPSYAGAADYYLATLASNFTAAHFVDVSTILISGQNRRAWVTTVNAVPGSDGSDYTMSQDEFDCVERTITIIAWASYRLDGRVADSRTKPGGVVDVIVPNSVAESLFQVACGSSETWPKAMHYGEHIDFGKIRSKLVADQLGQN